MRTTRSSSRPGGSPPGPPLSRHPPRPGTPLEQAPHTRSPSTSPLAVGLDQIPLNFPLSCGPWPDPPQFPPWLWAWTRSPYTSPLAVGLETCCKACWGTTCNAWWHNTHPPVDRHTPVNILPCPKLSLQAVISTRYFFFLLKDLFHLNSTFILLLFILFRHILNRRWSVAVV